MSLQQKLPVGGSKIVTLLAIIDAASGECDASDDPHGWLNWFCDDAPDRHGIDTFNLAINLGYIRTSRDDCTETSTAILTPKGRGALTLAKIATECFTS